MVNHLAVAPSVALALGSVAGIGAARVATAHYSVIVAETAQMMIAGPALVEQAGQPSVTKEDLGHARVHTSNGAIDDMVQSEAEAFDAAKRFLSYLPRNVDELPPRGPRHDDPERRDDKLLSIVPRSSRRVFKMRDIIASVFDEDSFFEMGRGWGRSMIAGLARLDGWPVAVLAEDPYVYGGAWTADASQKVIRHLDLASTFHLPVIHLEDCPGFLIGKDAEDTATIRVGSRALAALGQLSSPFARVVIRKAFGVAGAANNKPGDDPPPLLLAFGRLGQPADRGRVRGRLPGRTRRPAGRCVRRRSQQDPGSTQPLPQPVPVGGTVRDRRRHRPSGHPPHPLPVGQPGRPRPQTRPTGIHLPAVTPLRSPNGPARDHGHAQLLAGTCR